MTINLRKNRSGAWEYPGKKGLFRSSHGLTRLRRLCVVVGIVYLILIAVAGHVLMPNRVQEERAMVFAVTEEVRRYDGLAFVAESPSALYEAARREGFDSWIARVRRTYRIGPGADRDFEEIRKRYLQGIDSLGDRQKRLLYLLALAWVAPMAALYASACVMEWICRGRREKMD
jgi:AcrR family transcriptional regulator